MNATARVPSALLRALDGDEQVVAWLEADRRSARPRRNGSSAMVGIWVKAWTWRAGIPDSDDLPIPAHCYVALTDRRLVIAAAQRGDSKLDRRVSLLRIDGARECEAADGLAVARISLIDDRGLELAVPVARAAELSAFAAAVRDAARTRARASGQQRDRFSAGR